MRDRIDVRQVDEPRGYARESVTYVYEEGTLLVDIADARGKRVIWRGWVQADLTDLLTEPETMALRLGEVMRRMFMRFPRINAAAPVATPSAN